MRAAHNPLPVPGTAPSGIFAGRRDGDGGV